jgi:hypothetical protein
VNCILIDTRVIIIIIISATMLARNSRINMEKARRVCFNCGCSWALEYGQYFGVDIFSRK